MLSLIDENRIVVSKNLDLKIRFENSYRYVVLVSRNTTYFMGSKCSKWIHRRTDSRLDNGM